MKIDMNWTVFLLHTFNNKQCDHASSCEIVHKTQNRFCCSCRLVWSCPILSMPAKAQDCTCYIWTEHGTGSRLVYSWTLWIHSLIGLENFVGFGVWRRTRTQVLELGPRDGSLLRSGLVWSSLVWSYDALMMHWWCTDAALMMHWWCADDALMMHWWCNDDVLMMRW